MTTNYDRVRYPSLPHADLQPPELGAIAALCGHSGVKRARYRVLEIGCGTGVNLMSMSLAEPQGNYVGFDLSPNAIESGRRLAAATCLENVELQVRNVLESGPDLGQFDYIVAHGVYAWVPPAVQAALMQMVGSSLGRGGVAVITYNALPGCRIREALRDMLKAMTADCTTDEAVIARGRAFLAYQASGWDIGDPLLASLKREAEAQLAKPEGVLFHDELGEVYAPQMLRDVVAAGRAAGLDYLCDAAPGLLADALFPGPRFEAARPWSGGDWVKYEQLLDFSDMRRFRRSLFVRSGEVGDRRFSPGRLAGLHAVAELRPAPGKHAFAFLTPRNGEVETDDPEVGALLAQMGERFPAGASLDALADGGRVVEPLLRAVFSGAVTLRIQPHIFTLKPGMKPLASPLARAQAAMGEAQVASLRGGAARLGDAAVRSLLLLLDGTRTQAELAAQMASSANVPLAVAASRTSQTIVHLARLGLVMAA